ncbi:2-hydroxychromene-2-carboxylate isomerase [Sneathiella marina]|uniref:2-hydroxychromene-2-carboxylate isomerase n=1 Tax=Sneathiella marina TaxID=2950108 RepID=A0ABY4W3S8_9PROT|nr:2-hydroxychromene-2-carboxylate isomerase [Sneathiella marina]USG61845.1 2-hydroxychromene-2-carboxylate isomerase [Sneathiella marina]
MTVPVEFHFDFGSPNAYLSHKLIPAIESRTGSKFSYFPILLGGVFKLTNNKSPMEQFAGVMHKREYMSKETERFRRDNNLTDYASNPHFPVNTVQIMRGALVAQNEGYFAAYVNTVFSGMWEQSLKMDDAAVIIRTLDDAGLDGNHILERTQDPIIKKALIDNTNLSVERGNFGSPSFFVGEEMFFGKDRLEAVEQEINRQT